MEKNLGKPDRIFRFVLGLVSLYFGIFYFPDLILKVILIAFGLLMIIESLISHCYLYKLLGINTKKGEK